MKQRKVLWFVLYVAVGLGVLALLLVVRGDLPAGATDAAGIVIVLYVLGAIAFWVYLTTSAVLEDHVERVKRGEQVHDQHSEKP